MIYITRSKLGQLQNLGINAALTCDWWQ